MCPYSSQPSSLGTQGLWGHCFPGRPSLEEVERIPAKDLQLQGWKLGVGTGGRHHTVAPAGLVSLRLHECLPGRRISHQKDESAVGSRSKGLRQGGHSRRRSQVLLSAGQDDALQPGSSAPGTAGARSLCGSHSLLPLACVLTTCTSPPPASALRSQSKPQWPTQGQHPACQGYSKYLWN